MTKQPENNQAMTSEDKGRRKAVKTIVGGVTAIAAYNLLPAKWNVPYVESVFLPAHAATSGTVTISNFKARYIDAVLDYWNVYSIRIDSTIPGSYLIEFFNDSALTNSVFAPFTVSVPYDVANSSTGPVLKGDGLWCRATNTSDPSITGLGQATEV